MAEAKPRKRTRKKPSTPAQSQRYQLNCFHIMGIIVALVGVAMLAVVFSQTGFSRIGVPATGEVIDLDPNPCRRGFSGESPRRPEICGYHPVIQFWSRDETRYTFTSAFSDLPALFEVGDPVEILYNPDDPTQAEVTSKLDFFANPLFPIFSVVGIFLLLVGGTFLVSFFRH